VSASRDAAPGWSLLVVEDDPLHARLLTRALDHAGMGGHVAMVSDAEAALAVLRGGGISGLFGPLVVMLDLGLPGISGSDLLQVMKSDPKLRAIPVIVVSSSSDEGLIRQMYDQGANCYVTKDAAFADSDALARGIRQFWCGVASVPGRPVEGTDGREQPGGRDV
jgi:CheY-like chemotaxis protein